MDSYCDKRFFGKVGDQNGFQSDQILTTDENEQLKLKSICDIILLVKRVYTENVLVPQGKVAVFYSPEFEGELCIEGEVIFE